MIVIRRLEDIEYSRLKAIEEGLVPRPLGSVVVVAEDEEGEICGRLMLLPFLHLDGLWIRKDKRNSQLGARMEDAMTTMLKEAEIAGVQVDVYLPEMEGYLTRLGYEKSKIISVFRKEFEKDGN